MDFEKENEEKKDNFEFAQNIDELPKENIMSSNMEDFSQVQPVFSEVPDQFVKPIKNFNLELPFSNEISEPLQEIPNSNVDEETPIDEDEKPKRGGCLRKLIGLAIIICISIVLALTIIDVLNDMFGLYKPEKQIEVVIPKGKDSVRNR